MKQTKNIALAMTICLSLVLTGCNNVSTTVSSGRLELANSAAYIADGSIPRKTFTEIRESYERDVKAIKSKQYDNLNFDKAVFSPPPKIDSICELELENLSGKSTDEIYDFFCGAVDRLTGNKLSAEEKRHEIRFGDGSYTKEAPIPYQFPNIDDYKNGQETPDPKPYFEYENYYLEMGGVIGGFNSGDLIEYDNADCDNNAQYYMASNHTCVLYTEDLTSTETYRLIDGEISIADAAKFAQNYLENQIYTPYADANLVKPAVYAVRVYDIGNGFYGYTFLTTYEHNGVCFDHYDTERSVGGYSGVVTDYDKHHYGSWAGMIEMIRTDKIHQWNNVIWPYNLIDGEAVTEIIPLDAAADIVSEFYSGFMNFTITEVSMTWLTTHPSLEPENQAYPCWKFKMYADGEIYHTFVDVITGEIHLYVQVV